MSTYKTSCTICGTKFEIDTYDDDVCPTCGAMYEYDDGEAHRLVLSRAMRKAIQEKCQVARSGLLNLSPLEKLLLAQNERLQTENKSLLEAARQDAYVVEAGATLNVTGSIGFLFVEGGIVQMGASETVTSIEPA